MKKAFIKMPGIIERYKKCIDNTAKSVVKSKRLPTSELDEIASVITCRLQSKIHYIDETNPNCHALILRIIRQGVSEYLKKHINLPIPVEDKELEVGVTVNSPFLGMNIELQEFAEDVVGGLSKRELKGKYKERFYFLWEDLVLWQEEK